MPDRCAVSPAVFMTITWSHAAVAAIQERSGALAAAVAAIQARSVPPAAAAAAAAAAVAASCGLGSSRSVRWLQRPGQEQSQRQQALARPVAAARGRCRGWNSGGCSDLWRLLQRPAACVIAASSSLVGASCGSSSTCCTVQRPCRSVPWLQQHLLQPCRSVLWLQQHLLHRPAALHERPVAPAAPVAALH